MLNRDCPLLDHDDDRQGTSSACSRRRLRDDVKVMVGGAPVTQTWADKIGADCYSESASEQVDRAKALLG